MRPGEALDLDDLVARTGWPAGRLLDWLLEAELAGFVSRAGGGRFVRTGRK
jgi:predicted Rossmann fold nucleotide-binding protein DprA/Smf involved in DNA uptake